MRSLTTLSVTIKTKPRRWTLFSGLQTVEMSRTPASLWMVWRIPFTQQHGAPLFLHLQLMSERKHVLHQLVQQHQVHPPPLQTRSWPRWKRLLRTFLWLPPGWLLPKIIQAAWRLLSSPDLGDSRGSYLRKLSPTTRSMMTGLARALPGAVGCLPI